MTDIEREQMCRELVLNTVKSLANKCVSSEYISKKINNIKTSFEKWKELIKIENDIYDKQDKIFTERIVEEHNLNKLSKDWDEETEKNNINWDDLWESVQK